MACEMGADTPAHSKYLHTQTKEVAKALPTGTTLLNVWSPPSDKRICTSKPTQGDHPKIANLNQEAQARHGTSRLDAESLLLWLTVFITVM